MPQDIILVQPVRLQVGGGIEPDGKRKAVQFVFLAAGLNRNVPDEVATHPYIKTQLAQAMRILPREPAVAFSTQQLAMLDNLGLSPQQRQLLERLQTPPREAVTPPIAGDKQPAEPPASKTLTLPQKESPTKK